MTRKTCPTVRAWIVAPGLALCVLHALVSAGHEFVRFIPVAASTEGRFGTTWTTDVWIVAQARQSTVEVEIAFVDSLDPGDPQGVVVEVPWSPYSEPLVLTDIVRSVFNREGAGALLLRSDEPFEARSRTTNQTLAENGRVGQEVPALAKADLPSGPSSIVPGIANDPAPDGVRTNVGVFNRSSEAGDFQVSLYDRESRFLGFSNVSLGPYGWTQFDVFKRTGNPQAVVDDGFLLLFSYPRMAAYASVIDNASGDAVLLQPISRDDPRPDPRPECSLVLRVDRTAAATVKTIAYTRVSGVPVGVVPPGDEQWLADEVMQGETWSHTATVAINQGEQICASATGEQDGGTVALIISIECPHWGGARVAVSPDAVGGFDLAECINVEPRDP